MTGKAYGESTDAIIGGVQSGALERVWIHSEFEELTLIWISRDCNDMAHKNTSFRGKKER